MKFSVLVSIYHKEKAKYFNRAMHSIWEEQTTKPDEIILVEDGVLTDELYEAIDMWKKKLEDSLTIISIKENKGLGVALNIGLDNCSYEIVARMDTDDIADSSRFEKQVAFLRENPNIDMVGSWVSEFETDEKSIISYRKSPESHKEIINFAKRPGLIPATKKKKLHKRCLQVLEYLDEGLEYKEIAESMRIVERSVAAYISTIRKKLGIFEISCLINYAKSRGLIPAKGVKDGKEKGID